MMIVFKILLEYSVIIIIFRETKHVRGLAYCLFLMNMHYFSSDRSITM